MKLEKFKKYMRKRTKMSDKKEYTDSDAEAYIEDNKADIEERRADRDAAIDALRATYTT